MDKVLDQLNIPPQWSNTTGKGVRYAVLDYAPGNVIVTPVNSFSAIHYHSYSCQYIIQKIAPNAKGFGINVLSKASEGSWQMQDALRWCLENDIAVINMSLSGIRTHERIALIKKLINKGTVICAAAGNDGKEKLNFPADQPGVISVGAYVASTGEWWGVSNSGPEIEIIAPTYVDIPHWNKEKPAINFNGTSCATPAISGVACLWKEIFQTGNAYDFKDFLKTWAEDYGDPGFDNKTGYGKFRFPGPDQWITEEERMKDMAKRIFIDPGHGGSDPGAVGRIREADYALQYALALGEELTKQGFVVDYSRTTDLSVPLSIRGPAANRARADYFISTHFNAGGGIGIETFALAPGGQAEKLANAVQDSLVIHTEMKNRGVKFANFQVLRETSMPAILIEGGFVDSTDADQIKTETNKQNFVRGVSKGLFAFLGVQRKEEVNHMGKFKDVDDKKWYAASVDKAAELGLMNGTSADKFEPEKSLTRAELAAVAVRIYDKLNK